MPKKVARPVRQPPSAAVCSAQKTANRVANHNGRCFIEGILSIESVLQKMETPQEEVNDKCDLAAGI